MFILVRQTNHIVSDSNNYKYNLTCTKVQILIHVGGYYERFNLLLFWVYHYYSPLNSSKLIVANNELKNLTNQSLLNIVSFIILIKY